MKISTKGRYGLKAMVDIAVYGKRKHVSLKSVAERQNISEAYLEQLAASLKKAGLLNSIRGASGGYALAKPADKISIGEILRALEGPLTPVQCQTDGIGGCGTQNCGSCVSKSVWSKIGDSINETADSILLSELAADYEQIHPEIKENAYEQ